MTYHSIFRALLVSQLVFLAAPAAIAAVSEDECQQIRKRNTADKSFIYFERAGQFYPLTDDNWSILKDSFDNEVRFIYLAKSNDRRATLFLVKQAFVIEKSSKRVATYNNVRRVPKHVDFDPYQSYHKTGKGDRGAIRDLKQWLHLGPGFLHHRDFIKSDEYPEPLQFFAFDDSQAEQELKTHLYSLKGIRPEGSCFDFEPYISSKVTSLQLELRNLRPTETGDYHVWGARVGEGPH